MIIGGCDDEITPLGQFYDSLWWNIATLEDNISPFGAPALYLELVVHFGEHLGHMHGLVAHIYERGIKILNISIYLWGIVRGLETCSL